MACRRCGGCCDHMVLSFEIDQDWEIEKDWLLAHVGVTLESESGGTAHVRFQLPCGHLMPAADDRPAACRVHDERPQICVDYPDADTLDYLREHPWLMPNCGYRDRLPASGR